MAKLINIGSSSSGNSFVIEDGGCQVVLDLGFKFNKFQKRYREITERYIGGLGIDCCLVTHRHKDHSRGCQSFLENLADVFVPPTMKTDYRQRVANLGHSTTTITEDVVFVPFEVIHKDLAKNMQGLERKEFGETMVKIECYGYVIAFHKTNNIWLYMTDTAFLLPPLEKINYAIIECNHDLELIAENSDLHIQRALESHLSVQDVCNILKSSDTTALRKLFLMHISESNLNIKKAKKMIKEHYKGEVIFCKKNGGFYEI